MRGIDLFRASFAMLLIHDCGQAHGEIIDSEANVRLAFCHMLDRCPSPYETEVYAGIHRLPNARINELIRELAMLPEFELKFIANNSHAVDNLYLKILGRASNPEDRRTWRNVMRTLGYRYVASQFVDSIEYRHNFGTTLVPGINSCYGC